MKKIALIAWWFAAGGYVGGSVSGHTAVVALGPFVSLEQCDHYRAELKTWYAVNVTSCWWDGK